MTDVLGIVELRNLMRATRYDIVHTHLSKAGILGRVAARGRAPAVVHTVHMSSFGDGYGSMASLLYRMAERACAPMASAVVFVGNDLRRQYEAANVLPAGRATVIHSPIDVAAFLATRSWPEEKRTRVRLGLQLPRGTLLLAAGSLEPRKRFDLLVERVGGALQRMDASLAIAGDGPERRKLEVRAHGAGIRDRVHFLGHVRDMTSLVAASDLFVHVSGAEGVPQVVIQALAAGRPVVAADVAGLRELDNAPITILPSSGDGLEDILVGGTWRRSPLPEAAFGRWRCEAIDAGIVALHKTIKRRSAA